jgi:hypothetical protein
MTVSLSSFTRVVTPDIPAPSSAMFPVFSVQIILVPSVWNVLLVLKNQELKPQLQRSPLFKIFHNSSRQSRHVSFLLGAPALGTHSQDSNLLIALKSFVCLSLYQTPLFLPLTSCNRHI